jgi:hypothetical protein
VSAYSARTNAAQSDEVFDVCLGAAGGIGVRAALLRTNRAVSPLRICCINAPILYHTDMARCRPYGYAASMRRSCTIQTWHGVALPTNGQRTSHGHEHGPCPLVARSRPWRAQRNGACAAVSPGYASPLYRLAGSSKPSQLGNPGSLPVAGFLRSTGTLKRPLVYRRSVTCCHG